MSEAIIHTIYPENGTIPYFFEEIEINDRRSMQEHQIDHSVRHRFWHIHSGDIVIDVGCGFGVYTLCAIARGAKFVYSFESNPNVIRCLRANLAQNKDNINALAKCSAVKMRVDDQHSIDKFVEALSFPLIKLDWIKIDTGDVASNINVLQGARKTIAKFKPYILINGSDEAAASVQEYAKCRVMLMQEAGHRLVRFEP